MKKQENVNAKGTTGSSQGKQTKKLIIILLSNISHCMP